jgi:hypothetical protein
MDNPIMTSQGGQHAPDSAISHSLPYGVTTEIIAYR